MSEKQEFITVDEFARRIGVPEARVARWIRQGDLVHVRIGRTVLIPADALERLLDQEEHRS